MCNKKIFIICLVACPFFALAQNNTLSKQLLKKAEQENSNKDFEHAILDYSKAIELNPNDPWFWMMRGEARFKNKDTVNALADLNKSIQIDSNFSYGYFRRGYIKSQIGDKAGSEWDFNKSDDLKTPFFNKGRIKMKNGDFNGALKDFLVALSLHPKEPDIYFELAITERDLNDMFDSHIYLKKALELYRDYKP